ncbi:peptide ABC transporter permease [Vibrio zhanjiangensis]|uniref:Peptide ABC transporter permease n=1 Tax=Vibrio zhanjiangensis TaxID=1046128 RepID=A0ABQ6EZI9_9VIBR|nr:ABC transporter permease [Vibrio zhanjiangensis]GLT18459.1 peptide ABC transporter permease [Vibrio zhanjiangensis]
MVKGLLKLIWGNPLALVGSLIIAGFVIIAFTAPLLSKHAPHKRTGNPHEYPSIIVKSAQYFPDGWIAKNLATDKRTLLMSRKAEHILGTTRMGRDVWSQFVHGARVSLGVGFGAGISVCFLATVIGISAGYFGGRIDDLLTAAMNIMLVIPQYPLLFVLAAFIGEAGSLTIALIIAVTAWAWGARVIRAQTLALREKEFVKAAEVLGESSWRIIFVEILPNLVPIVGASFIGSVMYAIMMEATISFLGLGDPNTVSWGIMLYNVQTSSSMLVGAWWELLVPCTALILLVTGLALLNFAIDEMANPQLRAYKGLKRWRKISQQKSQQSPDTEPKNVLWSGDK